MERAHYLSVGLTILVYFNKIRISYSLTIRRQLDMVLLY